jgi:FkbM family methyltransferase
MRELAFRAFRRVARALSRFQRPLARVPGVVPLYRALYRRVKPAGLVQVHVAGATLWVRADDEGVARPLLLDGAFERDETALVTALLRPGMRVVDVGANVGYYTVLASRLVGPTGTVLAFEPEPENHALLVRNLAANGCRNAHAFPVALAERAGVTQLHRDRTNLGNPSMVGANVPDPAGAVEVETATLDDVLGGRGEGPIDFMKIDVQGAEGLVLAGAARTLRHDGLTILMELWPRGLANAGTDPARLLGDLAQQGFTLRLVDGTDRRRSPDEVLRAAARSQDGFVNLLLRRE